METQNPQLDIDRVELVEWLKTQIEKLVKHMKDFEDFHPYDIDRYYGKIDGLRYVLYCIQTNQFDINQVVIEENGERTKESEA
jgi:hypothetical protein